MSLADLFDSDTEDDRPDYVPPSASKAVRKAKTQAIRCTREAHLKKIFPDAIEPDHSYHFITGGDIDALSYPGVLIEKYTRFEESYWSTWTMSRVDVETLAGWLQNDQLGGVNVFTGEYFFRRETAVYATLLEMIKKHGGRLRTFKNHCKVILLKNEEKGLWLVIEGSANFTTNPRAEQTVINNSRELYEFYAAWFNELYQIKSKGKYNRRFIFDGTGPESEEDEG